jgi:hypothetical protein
MGDQPVARPLPAHRPAQTRNKRTKTSMPQVGFEPTIPVFERAKTVHALDCAATVIGMSPSNIVKVNRRMMGRAGHVQLLGDKTGNKIRLLGSRIWEGDER